MRPGRAADHSLPSSGSVGIATDYGLDGPGSNTYCKIGTGPFSRVKCGRGVLTTHRLLVPWSWKSRAVPLPTLWATPGL